MNPDFDLERRVASPVGALPVSGFYAFMHACRSSGTERTRRWWLRSKRADPLGGLLIHQLGLGGGAARGDLSGPRAKDLALHSIEKIIVFVLQIFCVAQRFTGLKLPPKSTDRTLPSAKP